jgi:peptidoglycan hydrolase-like protein with peptidoglycan-binding domain
MNGGKSIGALAGVTVVAMAASVLLAFATIDPPPLPVKHRKPQAAVPVAAPTSIAAPIPKVAVTPVAATPAPPPPKPAPPPKPVAPPSPSGQPTDWTTIASDELRSRANQNEIPAMEELGRRLLQGTDAPKDPQAGAGWLLRAASLGSVQSAFNVGVMYERGFVVERDSSKAAEWYRKAADAGLPTAKHNLALLLRDGKGTARDVKAAIQLLLSAAHQGMAASMFVLGDIYDQGDGVAKDPAAALAWFAITGEFERQTNRDAESALAKTAGQRAQVLKRTLTAAELERAQELAQGEFRRIVLELTPPPPAPAKASTPPPAPAPLDDAALDWPTGAADQVRAIQQALLDLKRLRDKPDGNLGPNTRAAIRDFQKAIGLRPTGEPSRDVYLALVSARHDIVRESPLPTPPPPPAASAAPAARVDEPKIDLGRTDPPPPPPSSAEVAAVARPAAPVPRIDDSKIDLGRTVAPPPPPSSAEVAAAQRPAPEPQKSEPQKSEPQKSDPPKPPPVAVDTTKPGPSTVVEAARPSPAPADIPLATAPPPPISADIAKADPNAWPASRLDQVKAIQMLLRDLRFYTKAIDGQANGGTQSAIREYQRMAGLKETGEASKALFDSLKEMRKLMAPIQH